MISGEAAVAWLEKKGLDTRAAFEKYWVLEGRSLLLNYCDSTSRECAESRVVDAVAGAKTAMQQSVFCSLPIYEVRFDRLSDIECDMYKGCYHLTHTFPDLGSWRPHDTATQRPLRFA